MKVLEEHCNLLIVKNILVLIDPLILSGFRFLVVCVFNSGHFLQFCVMHNCVCGEGGERIYYSDLR